MPVIPEFQPAAPSGSGFVQSQSLMQRAQAGRRAEEAQEMDRQKFEIMRPILESQARAQLVSEVATMSFQKQMTDYAASEMMSIPVLTQEWTEIRKIADPTERLQAQSDFIGRTAPLEGIPQAKPMVETWRNLFALDSNTEKANAIVAGRADVTGAVNDAKAVKTAADNEMRLKTAEMGLKAREDALKVQMERFREQQETAKEIAKIRTESAEKIAGGRNTTTETVAAGRAAGASARPKEAAARKYNETEIVSKVRPATEELPKFMRALDILESPEVRTGTAAGLETAARRFGEIFGFDVGKAAGLEELQSTLGSSFLSYVGQMKGAISDKETQALISMSPGVGKTAAGNIALVNNIVRALNRNIALGTLVLEGREAGETEAEIQSGVLRTMIETPMESFAPVRGPATSIQIKSIKQVSP